MSRRFGCRGTHNLYIVDILTLMEKERAKVQKYTKMVTNTKANGTTTSQTAKVIFGIKMETTISENGLMVKLTDKEYIHQIMDQLTMGNGKMTYNRDKAKKLGLINRILRVNIIRELSTAKENISTLMDLYTKETGATIKFQDKGFTPGPIKNHIMDNG